MTNINAARGAQVGYQIGNSLTNDTSPDGLQLLAPGARRYLVTDYDIRSSAELSYIVANPNDVTLQRGGVWNVGLPSKYRSLYAFQPYLTSLTAGSTQGTDASSILTFVTSARTGPSVAVANPYYGIFAAWPQLTAISGNYQAYWAQSVVNDSNTPTIMKADYFTNLYTVLLSTLPTPPYLIPVGQVFNQLDIMTRAGQVPGATTVADFYRDNIHMGTVGRFVAACTLFSCWFGVKAAADAATIALYQSYGGSTLTLDQSMATLMQDTVWSVISADPRTGRG